MKIKYFVCGFSRDNGKTISGRPQLLTDEERRAAEGKAKDARDAKYKVVVLEEVEVEQE